MKTLCRVCPHLLVDHDSCCERRLPAVDAVFVDVRDENRADSRVCASGPGGVRRTTDNRNVAGYRIRIPRQKCTEKCAVSTVTLLTNKIMVDRLQAWDRRLCIQYGYAHLILSFDLIFSLCFRFWAVR